MRQTYVFVLFLFYLSNLIIADYYALDYTPILRLNFNMIYRIWIKYDAGKDTELVAVSNIPT